MQLKRFVITCLVVILTVSALVISVASADADPLKVAVEVSSSTAILNEPLTVKPGDEISVSVTITQNPGISVMQYYMYYDTDALTLKNTTEAVSGKTYSLITDYEQAEVPIFNKVQLQSYTESDGRGVIKMVTTENFFTAENSYNTGVLFTLTFTVNQAFDGDSVFDYLFDSDSHTMNENGDAVPAEVASNADFSVHHLNDGVTVEPGCEADGYTTFSCTLCDYTVDVPGESALGHTEVIDAAVEPTCLGTGLTEGMHCSDCDEVLIPQEIRPALGHTIVTDPAEDATCLETGLTEGSHCSTCDEVLEAQQTVPALGHDEITHEAKTPECTTIGWNAYVTCSRCDYTTYEEIPALGHDEVDHEAKTPECTTIGWNAYVTCNRCDYTTYEKIPALGHDEVDHEAKTPECTTIGWNAYVTCNRCDYTTYEEIPALGHDEITHEAKTPECTTIGWNAYVTCSRCDYTTYEEIPALGHDEITHEAKEPTCTEVGHEAYVTCSRGDCDYTTYEEIPALGHDEITHEAKESTCAEVGHEAYVTCSRCDYTTYQEIAMLPHVPKILHAVAATCTESGWTTGLGCENCDTLTIQPTEIPATGHTDGPAATCTEDQVCTVCSEVLKEATGHAEGSAATCTEDQICTVCGEVLDPAFDHTWSDWEIIQQPTEEAEGKKTRSCSVCGAVEEGKIPQLDHVHRYTHEVIAPTCTEQGYTLYTCVCGDNYKDLYTDVIDHDFSETVTAPTCTEQGYTTYTCDVCGHSEKGAYVDQNGHDDSGADATCISPEYCAVCGVKIADQLNHMTEWTFVSGQDATCLDMGWEDYVYCATCDVYPKEKVDIQPLGHNEVVLEAVPATCTADGLTEGLCCDRCDTVLTEQETVTALGHKYEGVYTEPTFEADGYTTYTCSVCGDDYVTPDEDSQLTAVAEINGVKYESLAEAIAAAKDGDTVILLMNAEGDGAVIDQSITIDLNGFTYTVSGKTVGSVGTETQGFQILAGNDVTIKNGTINTSTDGCKMLIQNYANLTLSDVTLDGTGSANMLYVLSNNSGEINIIGNTSIVAPEGAVAFDVCKFMDYPAPVVNVNTTGKIIGNIEVSEEISENLNISGGQFTTKLEEAWCEEGYVPGDKNADGFYSPITTESAVAAIGDVYYKTLAEALSAAAKGDTVLLLADVTSDTTVTLGEAILDLNGYTLRGKTVGTVKMNGGTLISAEGVTVAAPAGADYLTTDAVMMLAENNDMTIVSGTVTLGKSIRTQSGHTLTVSEGAVFVIPTDVTLNVGGHVIVNGTLTVEGTLNLASKDAVITAAEGLTLKTDAGDKVWYVEGQYIVHDHTPGDAATCLTAQICTVCEDMLVSALGHDCVTHEAQDPTCTEIGWDAYDTCTRCDYTTYKEKAAKGHTPGSAATCTTAQTCTVCNAELTPAKGHTPGSAATCTTAQTCTVCNAELTPAKGHTSGSAATCTTAQTCTVCNAELAPAKGHTPGPAATCTTAQTCTVCNAELAPAKGHTEVVDAAVAPTCTETGLTEGKHCSVCNEVLTAQETVDALGHTAGAEATCTTAQTCTVCNAELAPAKGHTEVVDAAVAPTCTETGLTEGKHCSVCNEVLTAQETVDALGHTAGAEATCTTAQTCTVCNAELTPAKGHTEVVDAAVAPTCTEAGKTEGKHCSACNEVLTAQESVPAKGHTLVVDAAKEPTYSETGLTEGSHCSVCQEILTEQKIIDAKSTAPIWIACVAGVLVLGGGGVGVFFYLKKTGKIGPKKRHSSDSSEK